MKSKADVLVEAKVADIILRLLYEAHDDNFYEELTTSDLQGICLAKAMDIVKMVKEAKK